LANQNIKIVSLVWYKILPAQFGGQQAIVGFNEALSKKESLICLCSKNNQPSGDESFTTYPVLPNNKWQFLNPITWWLIFSFCKKEKATHLIVEHPYHVIAAWLVKIKLNVTIIHRSHNIEFDRFKLLRKKYWRMIFYAEKWMCQIAMMNLFITNEDRLKAIKEFSIDGSKCLLLPHEIKEKNISKRAQSTQLIKVQYTIANDQSIFLFNGTLDYEPNANAVKSIANFLIPELNKTNANFIFIITGRIENKAFEYLLQLANKQLIFTGKVANIEDYFLACDVYVNPVNMGGGVQTKTLEALSYHLNVVCFENMLNGIEVDLVKDKIFAVKNHNWEQFAEKIMKANLLKTTTPSAFFKYQNYDNHLPKLLDFLT
jgi:hypothetical protein